MPGGAAVEGPTSKGKGVVCKMLTWRDYHGLAGK